MSQQAARQETKRPAGVLAQGTPGVVVLNSTHHAEKHHNPPPCLGSSPDLLGRVHSEGDPNQPPPRHHFRRPHGERASLPQPTIHLSLQPGCCAAGSTTRFRQPGAGGAGRYHRGGGGGLPPTLREWYRPPSRRALRHGGGPARGQLLAAGGIAERAVLLNGRKARALPVRLCRSLSGGKRRTRRRWHRGGMNGTVGGVV